jgi:surfeit locus 1 family protein
MSFVFRPTLWPTLFTVPALATLVALGTWQLHRLEWKQDLIDKLQTRSVAAPAAPPAAGADLAAFEFQRVRVKGRFRHDRELYLIGRALSGTPGLHILTPLIPDDGTPPILIDRGWVPFEGRDPATRPGGQVDGSVAVDGIVRLQKEKGYFVPDNDPVKNTWYFVDIEAMSTVAGVDLRPGYYVVADAAALPGGFPKGGQWRLDLRNDHLQYAFTWYSLAFALLVIYVLYHSRRN